MCKLTRRLKMPWISLFLPSMILSPLVNVLIRICREYPYKTRSPTLYIAILPWMTSTSILLIAIIGLHDNTTTFHGILCQNYYVHFATQFLYTNTSMTFFLSCLLFSSANGSSHMLIWYDMIWNNIGKYRTISWSLTTFFGTLQFDLSFIIISPLLCKTTHTRWDGIV